METKKRTNEYVLSNGYILVFGDTAFFIGNDYYIVKIKDNYAIGAGKNFALTALHLGHDVKMAVSVACDLSLYCEKPIVYYEKYVA